MARFNQKKPFHHRRINFVVDERFQWRYTRYLVTTGLVAAVVTGGVAGYFLNQNYGIFNRLAYLHAPDLLPQLEREQVWINWFLVAFCFTLLGFNLHFGLKMTSRIAGPIMVLRRHIRYLSHGYFFQRPLRTRENDEFKDLITSYNYLYLSLRAQLEKDIKKLEEALDEKDPRKSKDLINGLIAEKTSQLTDSSDETAPTGDSRHAS